MKIPLSWVKDFVDIDLSIAELAHKLTLAGLEVEEIQFVGLPLPGGERDSDHPETHLETSVSGLAWDPEKILVAEIREVMPHPDADRLVLARLFDGEEEHTILTGAPNLFSYKGQGEIDPPLKVTYAREGAQLYDGHKPGLELMTLKRATIRGVESYSMVCSEKELGISEEHEGVILLAEDAPTGVPLADYIGDAVLEIAITPNIARNANILGVAREIAALTGVALKQPDYEVDWTGPSIQGRLSVEIRQPDLNPRFVLGLIENVTIAPSPYEIQRRLRLAGMRPINNIVDATNYAMLEVGEPLHAFDYDELVKRAGEKPPALHTRTAEADETLLTLDGVERSLDEFTVLVADQSGALSIGGVMGGAESEVSDSTTHVLLEGAAWNFINIRRTIASQHISSEAAYRFSRGVHPAVAERGVRRGLSLMHKYAGGEVAQGLIDEYPLPPEISEVQITEADALRWLGASIPVEEMAEILRRLQFEVDVEGSTISARPPDHRLDIGEGIIGMSDLMEEIARIYGYDRIPERLMEDELPPQIGNRPLELEEQIRDILVNLGYQEIVTYRLTSPESEDRWLLPDLPADDRPYVELRNPISNDRRVLRHNLLVSVLEVLEKNIQVNDRLTVFEIAPEYFSAEDEPLPDEVVRLALAQTGPRAQPGWQGGDLEPMDFFDLKGSIEALLSGMKLEGVHFESAARASFHPGKSAEVYAGDRRLGHFGELHPLVAERFGLSELPVLLAIFDLEPILASVPDAVELRPVPAYPPVLEDLALVVDEALPAMHLEAVIWEAGGDLVADVRLFDVYRGKQLGAGLKSLAYSITYQALDRTLTDEEVARVRNRIVKKVSGKLGAELRS